MVIAGDDKVSASMYYIAIVAPPEINDQVLQWKHFMRDRFRCVVALKSPAHITLASPFWMNKDLQPQLQQSLQAFNNDRRSFEITLKDFGAFKPRVIFVHVEPSETLSMLKVELENCLLSNPLFPTKRETRPYHPHITIANRDLQKKDFTPAWEYFSGKKYENTFLAPGVSLMKHNGTHWEEAFVAGFPF